jgi:hypothetical protein
MINESIGAVGVKIFALKDNGLIYIRLPDLILGLWQYHPDSLSFLGTTFSPVMAFFSRLSISVSQGASFHHIFLKNKIVAKKTT